MVKCITSTRFNMKADILRQTSGTSTPSADGRWEDAQDPITGEIIRKWITIPDDVNTPVNESSVLGFPCLARGIIGAGLRGDGTSEQWGELYSETDYVRIEFSSRVILTQRDRVTNIRNRKGTVLWREEALPQGASGVPTFLSTVFDVKGVTPVLDPFGSHTSNVALLERAAVQSA